MYKYKSDWCRFAFPDGESSFATIEDLKEILSKVDLSADRFSTCGIPVYSEGQDLYVISETEHSLIIGQSGSKKTRSIISPLIPMAAGAGESSFIIDVKGELSSNQKIRNYLDAKGIKQVFIDFRNFNADGYNMLEHIAELYIKGQTDKAMAQLNTFIRSLTSRYFGSKMDPFWPIMSEEHLNPILAMLLENAKNNEEHFKYINMLSVSTFANEHGTHALENLIDDHYRDSVNPHIQMLKGVLSAPDRTRSSIVSTTSSVLRDFLIQENLLKMMSTSTFDIAKMYEEPTCVFIIIPDTTSAYDDICGMLIDSFYHQLIDIYTDKYQNYEAPPCRINWIADEFCNIKIQDMRAKISASRSRCMRWFIVCQSLKMLADAYPEDSATIIGNVKNIMFMQSACPDTLDYISKMCGTTTISDTGYSEPLLSVERLRKLKQSYKFKEAIFIRDDLIYRAVLPDFDCYDYLCPYADDKICTIPVRELPDVEAYSPHKMMSDIFRGLITPPFIKEEKTEADNAETDSPSEIASNSAIDYDDLYKELERKFDELFGDIDAETGDYDDEAYKYDDEDDEFDDEDD